MLVIEKVYLSVDIVATRTSISRTTGVFTRTTETHPLTEVQASVQEFGGAYSHRTLSRTAGGAVIGGMVGMPVLGAVMAPNKKVDNRQLQVTVRGRGFCWTYTAPVAPHQKISQINDWAAKYTLDPHGVEFALKLDAHKAEQRSLFHEAGWVQRKLTRLIEDNQRDRTEIAALAARAVDERATGKARRAARHDKAAERLRQKLRARHAEKIEPLRQRQRDAIKQLGTIDDRVIAECGAEAKHLRGLLDLVAARAREDFALHLRKQLTLRAEQMTALEQWCSQDAGATTACLEPSASRPALPAS